MGLATRARGKEGSRIKGRAEQLEREVPRQAESTGADKAKGNSTLLLLLPRKERGAPGRPKEGTRDTKVRTEVEKGFAALCYLDGTRVVAEREKGNEGAQTPTRGEV